MSARRRALGQLLATVGLGTAILIGCGSTDESASPTSSTPSSTTASLGATTEGPVADSGPQFVPSGRPELLSEWRQLAVSDGELQVDDLVTPYSLNSALFSDHAQKLRTIWLPEDASPAGYDAEEVFDFPVGTVITKTFYYARADDGRDRVTGDAAESDVERRLDLAKVRLIETRILAHRDDGWVALPYVWNEQQTDAVLMRTGDLQNLTFVDGSDEIDFPYVVPNANQCAGCHATNHTEGVIRPIGPKARHLNRDVDLGTGVMPQLAQWEALGLVATVPADAPRAAAWDDDTAPLSDRARAYLDINCAHCHNQNGPADTSGLFLEASTDAGPRLGICKPPVAAGTGTGNRVVGIDPGHPDDSIFIFRMTTRDPGAMMPELGRSLIHDDGVDLIAEWITSLDGECS